jgi:hypothetical protein
MQEKNRGTCAELHDMHNPQIFEEKKLIYRVFLYELLRSICWRKFGLACYKLCENMQVLVIL